MKQIQKTAFAPLLYIGNGVTDIGFYSKAFNAIELRRFSNEDGSIHVAELSIDGEMFHLHEQHISNGKFSPFTIHGTTTNIGLMVEDVDGLMKSAIAAGATEISPAQDYDYGFRQGEIKDPFGHVWTLEKIITS